MIMGWGTALVPAEPGCKGCRRRLRRVLANAEGATGSGVPSKVWCAVVLPRAVVTPSRKIEAIFGWPLGRLAPAGAWSLWAPLAWMPLAERSSRGVRALTLKRRKQKSRRWLVSDGCGAPPLPCQSVRSNHLRAARFASMIACGWARARVMHVLEQLRSSSRRRRGDRGAAFDCGIARAHGAAAARLT